MTADSKHIDYLITRYLAGEATHEEQQKLELWMNESEVNKKYFIDHRFIHDQVVASNRFVKVDVDTAWNKLHRQMNSVSKKSNQPAIKKVFFDLPIWLRVAAVFLILTGLSFWLYINFFNVPEVKTIAIISHDSIVSRKLADNSTITLNKRTKIILSSQFGKKNRELALNGEAYFKIRHSADTPFIVKAEEVLIKDVGTAFNVKAYNDSKTIEVYVESGEVLLYTSENPGITLTKGETGVYDKSVKNFHKTKSPEINALSYKTKVFVFQNTNLMEAINKLNAVYPESIRINNNILMNCKITVTFNNEDISTIASIIAETMGLHVIKTPDGYLLEGEACINSK